MSDSQRQHADYVVFPRAALFEFFGRMALPPWRDERGRLIGRNIDCAPIATEIEAWVEANQHRPMSGQPVPDADTVRLLRAARNYLRADENEARANHPYSMEFLAFLAEVDDHLRQIDGDES